MANIRKRILLAHFIRHLAYNSRRGEAYKRRLRNHALKIESFSRHIGKPLYSNSFTAQMMEEFVYYLKNHEKKYAQNTVRAFVQKTGEAIRKADKAGYKIDYGFEEIQIKKEDSAAVYLTEEEIERLFNLKGLSREAYAARERFVVACCIGMRIGDVRALTADNFQGEKVLMKTRKTGAQVVIPQHRFVREILKRNNGDLPTLHSQQAYNTMVKRLCKRAKINDKVLVERTRGTKVERKLFPKYSLISSHTARRSLATNMYLRGIPAARIMLITGHTTEQSFFAYIRINKFENAKTLAEHPFFN